MPHLEDLSHEIESGMVTYKGLPGPVISDFLTREQSRERYTGGTEFQIGRIEMVANTGTYVDSPFHRFATGKDLASLRLDSIANVPGVVLRANQDKRAVDVDVFASHRLRGKAVLIHTGWDRHWRTPEYFEGNPFLTRAACQFLADAEAVLVGIDSVNIDDMGDGTRPAHTILLKARIPIVEHLCRLDSLPNEGFTFFAVPPKVKGMGSFPVRAYAVVS